MGHISSRPPASEAGHPSTTRCASGPPPLRGEDFARSSPLGEEHLEHRRRFASRPVRRKFQVDDGRSAGRRSAARARPRRPSRLARRNKGDRAWTCVIAPAHIAQGSSVTHRSHPSSLPVPSAPSAARIASISACAVGSPSDRIRLAAVAISAPSRVTTAPTGTSPAAPAFTAASSAQRIGSGSGKGHRH